MELWTARPREGVRSQRYVFPLVPFIQLRLRYRPKLSDAYRIPTILYTKKAHLILCEVGDEGNDNEDPSSDNESTTPPVPKPERPWSTGGGEQLPLF